MATQTAQTTERLALGWVLVTPVDGAPYYAHPRTQQTQYDEPHELRELRQLSQSLVHTAEAGDAVEVEKLLVQGADVNVQDPAGVTPAIKASIFGNTHALARLLSEGPDLSTRDHEHGRTALLWAVFSGHCVGDQSGGCVGMLIRAGANPEDVDKDGKGAMDLCCLALDSQPDVQAERYPIIERLLSVLKIWGKLCRSHDAITKLVRQGQFGAAERNANETLATMKEFLAANHLSEIERTEFEAMERTMQTFRRRCEFGAKRRAVERSLAKAKALPKRTLDEVDIALAEADAALLAYEEISEECHSWAANTNEEWHDVEAAGVAAGLEACEELTSLLRADHVRFEKEHTAELHRLAADKAKAAADERQRKASEQRKRQDKQRRRNQALEEARARRAAREKAIADAKHRAETERALQERADGEDREVQAALEHHRDRLQLATLSRILVRRLQVKKQKRLKDKRRRNAKLEVAARLGGDLALRHIEHERDKIIYNAALASEEIAETKRIRQDLEWQSPADAWQYAVDLAFAATDKYSAALAIVSKTPSALNDHAAAELMKSAEAAHELADILEEEAQSAEDRRLAHSAVMNATGDLRAHVVDKIGGHSGVSALVIGEEPETEHQKLHRAARALQRSDCRPQQSGQPTRVENVANFQRLGTELRVKMAQHQADHDTLAHNEGILRAQKSARRRMVEEAHRKAAVDQLVRSADLAAVAGGGQMFQPQPTIDGSVLEDFGLHRPSARLWTPDWIDEANGKPNARAITFTSPRQIKLQTESEYKKQRQAAVAASTSIDDARLKLAMRRAQQPTRIGIQGASSTRSFPDMLPQDMPAALYLTMQQRELDRAAKDEERRAREEGWRASTQIDPTPPEKRVYKYGDVDIKVGGRGSKMVDATVSEIRNQQFEHLLGRGASYDYATQMAGLQKEPVQDMMSTSMTSPISHSRAANRPSSKLAASSGRRATVSITDQRGVPTDSELDRYWSSVMIRKHDLGRDLPHHNEIRAKMQTPPRNDVHRTRGAEIEASGSGYDASALHTTPRSRRVNLDKVQPRVDSWSFRSKKPQLNQQVQPLLRW